MLSLNTLRFILRGPFVSTFKIQAVFFLYLFLVAPSLVSGDSGSLDGILSSYRVYNLSTEQMNQIAEKFEITRRLYDKVNVGYEVIVPVSEKRTFFEIAPDALLIERDISQKVIRTRFQFAGAERYRSFDEVIEVMRQLEQSRPDLVEVVQYGESARGLPLLALKLSDNVKADENEPELLLTAATHGDEIITTEVLVRMIEEAVSSYGADTRWTNLIHDREIYFVPVVNPDGFTRAQRYEGLQDPNRSYPYPEKVDAKPTPSIAALIQFFESRDFAGSIDFHAYGEMIMYPWAYTYSEVDSKDKNTFHQLTQKMAETNSYKYGPISKVIYVAKGSSADYYYWKKKTVALAIEIGTSKAPPPQSIPQSYLEQKEPTLRFLEAF